MPDMIYMTSWIDRQTGCISAYQGQHRISAALSKKDLQSMHSCGLDNIICLQKNRMRRMTMMMMMMLTRMIEMLIEMMIERYRDIDKSIYMSVRKVLTFSDEQGRSVSQGHSEKLLPCL